MQITLPTPALFAAASQFMEYTNKGRLHLMGVRIEPDGNGGAFIVSTNGHMMFVAYEPAYDGDDKPVTVFFPPNKPLPMKWIGQRGECRIDLDAGTITAGNLVERVRNDDYEFFPQWRGVTRDLGRSELAPVRGFNPDNVVLIARVAKALGRNGQLGCRQVGLDRPMLFQISEHAYVVAMGATSKIPIPTVPEWFVAAE